MKLPEGTSLRAGLRARLDGGDCEDGDMLFPEDF